MRSRIVLGAGALLVIGAVIAIVAAFVETDEEKIEKLVERMRDAAERSDVEGIMAGLSEEVDFPGGRAKLQARIRGVLKQAPPKSVSVESFGLDA